MPRRALDQLDSPTPSPVPSEATAPTPAINIVHVTLETPVEDVIQSDLDLTNVAAVSLYSEWGQAGNRSIKEIAALFKMTVAFTKHRRKLLNIPYGTEKGSGAEKSIVYPVD